MRIAIIISRLAQLGPVKVMQSLVNLLAEVPDVQLKLFYIDKKTDSEVKILVPAERLIRSKFCFEDFDIIHTNGIRPDFFAWINRKRIKHHISTIHNFVFEDLSYSYNKAISLIFGYLWLFLWRKADKLVCVSNSAKDYYEKWFPESRLKVVYNGITELDNSLIPDADIIKAIERYKSDGLKVIGSAGMLTKRKGIDRILSFIGEDNKYAFIIIGDGDELPGLKNQAKKLKISDRIFFSEFRKNADIYFKYFDFFMMPSWSEGFGLALVEAVQQKTPVVCSDIPVFRELFSVEEVSFFSLNENFSLNEALKEATERGKEKAVLAYARYANNYTAKRMAKGYYNLYKSA